MEKYEVAAKDAAGLGTRAAAQLSKCLAEEDLVAGKVCPRKTTGVWKGT